MKMAVWDHILTQTLHLVFPFFFFSTILFFISALENWWRQIKTIQSQIWSFQSTYKLAWLNRTSCLFVFSLSSSSSSSSVPSHFLPYLVCRGFVSFSLHFYSSTKASLPRTLYLQLKTPCIFPLENCTCCRQRRHAMPLYYLILKYV